MRAFILINKNCTTYVLFTGDWHHATDRASININLHVSFQHMGNLVACFSDLWYSNILALTYRFSPHQRSYDNKHITINKLRRQMTVTGLEPTIT